MDFPLSLKSDQPILYIISWCFSPKTHLHYLFKANKTRNYFYLFMQTANPCHKVIDTPTTNTCIEKLW